MKALREQNAATPALLGRLWRSMSVSIRRRTIATLGAMVMAGAAEFVMMVALRHLLVAITGADGAGGAQAIALFALASALVAATRLVAFSALDRLAIEYAAFASAAIFRRAMRKSYADYRTTKSADLFVALENSQRLLNSALIPLLQAIVSAITAVIITIYMLRLAPAIVIPMLGFALAVYLLSALVTRKRLRHSSAVLQQLATERLQVAHAAQRGFRDLILGQGLAGAVNAFAEIERRYRARQIRARLATTVPRHVIELLVASLLIALALYGASLPGGIMPHIPLFATIALGMQRLLPLSSSFYTGWSNFQSNSAFLTQTLDAMPDGPEPPESGVFEVPFEDRIVFENTSLSYPERGLVLDRVRLTIPHGSRIGIVGPSGSGKSSLLDLLVGLIAPSEGLISVDGMPLDTPERRRNWQCGIACVSQSSYLPDTNLADAIAGDGEMVDPKRVRTALRGASLDAFVAALPEGLATRLGEAGVLLSGGQRQRIAIARALYRGASLLVLDEITSNLDEATERAIVQTLAALGRNVTIVIATHRAAPLDVCDQVYALDHGSLRAIGATV